MDNITPFQRYLHDHTELRAENALKVYRLYDNHVMSEDDAKVAMVAEVQEFIKLVSPAHPNLALFREIVRFNTESVAAPVAAVAVVEDVVVAPEVVEKNSVSEES
jgi:hypothetical protein